MFNFPNLSSVKAIALDVETYDPHLLDYGPGWGRNSGYIVGVAIGADSDKQWYFPVRHSVDAHWNYCPEKVFDFLRDLLKDNRPKIGANLIYDIGWLEEENVKVSGQLFDVQFAEALLSETDKVELDSLAKKYLGREKEKNKLYEWIKNHYTKVKDPRAFIHKAPPSLSSAYAKADVELPIKVLKKQVPLLQDLGLYDLFLRENAQIPVLVKMRQKGVRVNVERAEFLKKKIDIQIKKELSSFEKKYGKENINSNKQLAVLFDRHNISYPKTKKGNPAFQAKFLEQNKHPLAQKIVEIRKLTHVSDVFLQSYIINTHVNGRIHCSFHPLKNDSYGTRSGRYSSSNPNLQNIPYRDPIWGKIIRGLFLPNSDKDNWVKIDLSQIEYRFLAHFAVGKNSELVREQYNNDPTTDYHKFTQNLILEKTGKAIERPQTKNINFGGIYGMGEKTLCAQLGITRKEGSELFKAYHEGMPFAKATLDYYSNLAQKQGFVQTILGRRSYFNLFEDYTVWDSKPLPYNEAIKQYGLVKRAKTYTALNRVLQGSATDYLKEVTLQCHEKGLFEKYGFPLLTVHDELDFSLRDKSAIKEIKKVFETAINLSLPIKASVLSGKNWGDCVD